MKICFKLILLAILWQQTACSNNKTANDNAEKKSPESAAVQTSATGNENAGTDGGLVGEWDRHQVGRDNNKNGVLDAGEEEKDNGLSGTDYFKLNSNGTCIWDKDIKFEGTWKVKPYKENRRLYLYSKDLPSGLSEEERDRNSQAFTIKSLTSNQVMLAPAHLAPIVVVYKRR